MSDFWAAVLYLGVMVACLIVVALMINRRGPWRRRPDDIDWTTTDGCRRCDEHGPFWSDLEYTTRDAHRAWHEIAVVVLGPVGRFVKRSGTPRAVHAGQRHGVAH